MYTTFLNKKTRRAYFEYVASQPASGSNYFWKLCKPFLADKHTDSEKSHSEYNKK